MNRISKGIKLLGAFGPITKLAGKLPSSLLIVALLSFVTGSYITHKIHKMGDDRQALTQLEMQIDKLKAAKTLNDERAINVAQSSTRLINEVNVRLEEIRNDSQAIQRSINETVTDNRTCDLSGDTIKLLRSATQSANNSATGLPDTAAVSLDGTATDPYTESVSQRLQLNHQIEQLRVCGEIRSKYITLIKWIMENQVNNKDQAP